MEALSSSHVLIFPFNISYNRVAVPILCITEQIGLPGCTLAVFVKGNESNELTEVLHRESGEYGTLQNRIVLKGQLDGRVRNSWDRTFAGALAVRTAGSAVTWVAAADICCECFFTNM